MGRNNPPPPPSMPRTPELNPTPPRTAAARSAPSIPWTAKPGPARGRGRGGGAKPGQGPVPEPGTGAGVGTGARDRGRGRYRSQGPGNRPVLEPGGGGGEPGSRAGGQGGRQPRHPTLSPPPPRVFPELLPGFWQVWSGASSGAGCGGRVQVCVRRVPPLPTAGVGPVQRG